MLSRDKAAGERIVIHRARSVAKSDLIGFSSETQYPVGPKDSLRCRRMHNESDRMTPGGVFVWNLDMHTDIHSNVDTTSRFRLAHLLVPVGEHQPSGDSDSSSVYSDRARAPGIVASSASLCYLLLVLLLVYIWYLVDQTAVLRSE